MRRPLLVRGIDEDRDSRPSSTVNGSAPRSKFRRALFAVGTSALLIVGTGGGQSAQADTVPPTNTPATVSADALPTWQVNGVVWSEVVVGSTVYVTGSFTKARPPGVPTGGAGEVTANDIFAFNITTGNRVSAFNHALSAQGRSVVASPDGSRIYVGGDFTSVDGVAHGHVAAFNAGTGSLDASFNVNVSNTARALAATASTVFIGGGYGAVNGQSRQGLSAVSATTGALLGWAPTVAGGSVWSMVVAPDQSRLIVGGSFTTLNGQPAYGMGSLAVTTGGNLPWAANQVIKDATSTGAITSLRTDGTQIYGSGYAYGSGSSFEGTFAANPTSGAITLLNDCHGDTYDVLPLGTVLYSVSHAHDCTAIGSFPDTNPRVRWQRALAQTKYSTTTNKGPDSYGWNYSGQPASTVLQWFPQLDAGSYTGQTQAAWALAGNATYVVLGGEFPTVNGAAQQGLVRMAVAASAPNRRGPSYTTKPSRPVPATTASYVLPGSIRVTFGTAWDYDNESLTYDLMRDGAVVIHTTQIKTNFWTLLTAAYTDTGLTPGTTHSYQVRIKDPFGNTIFSPASNSVTA
jgi:hypothetical protein